MSYIRQSAYDLGIVQFSFERAQHLLLTCRAPKVAHQVCMSRTYVFKCVWPSEVLWPWWDIYTLVGIDITCMIIDIIWIIVIGNGMQHIDIDATDRIYHFDEAIQSNPCVVVDRNAKILINREAAQCNA